MPAGKVGTNPRIHNTWSACATFHRPAPGTAPVTVTACRVVIDDAEAGWVDDAVCAAAQAQVSSNASVTGMMRMLQ